MSAGRQWPPTATPEIRRSAVRGDSISAAHVAISDLIPCGLDRDQRAELTRILGSVWDDGCDYQPAEPATEYGCRMASGDHILMTTDPAVERVAPVAFRIETARRDGDRVFRRRIIVLDDWSEVTGPVGGPCPT